MRNAMRARFFRSHHFLESNLLAEIGERARHAARLQGKSGSPDKNHVTSSESLANTVTALRSDRQQSAVHRPPRSATLTPKSATTNPPIALFGGEEGYELYAGLITQSAAHLKPGGILVLELGHDSPCPPSAALASPAWTNIGVTNDLAGIPRVVSAEKT